MRILFSILLCLSLAATSVSAAVMHSEMQGATEMTICSDAAGQGVVQLTVDATGKPIQGHHHCPECLAGLATTILPSQLVIAAPQTVARSLYPMRACAGTSRPSPAATARGPPLFA